MFINGLLKRHGGNHCRVPNGLQVHESAVLSTLEFNDHQVSLLIESQQIDAAFAVFPLGKLFSEHE